jgi:callose synthase
MTTVDYEETNSGNPEGYKSSLVARGLSDLKFTYVVTCQIYGQQKQKQDHRADDILFLMQKYICFHKKFITVSLNA